MNVIAQFPSSKVTIEAIRERLVAIADDMEKLRRDHVTVEFNITFDSAAGRMRLDHFRAFRTEEMT